MPVSYQRRRAHKVSEPLRRCSIPTTVVITKYPRRGLRPRCRVVVCPKPARIFDRAFPRQRAPHIAPRPTTTRSFTLCALRYVMGQDDSSPGESFRASCVGFPPTGFLCSAADAKQSGASFNTPCRCRFPGVALSVFKPCFSIAALPQPWRQSPHQPVFFPRLRCRVMPVCVLRAFASSKFQACRRAASMCTHLHGA